MWIVIEMDTYPWTWTVSIPDCRMAGTADIEQGTSFVDANSRKCVYVNCCALGKVRVQQVH